MVRFFLLSFFLMYKYFLNILKNIYYKNYLMILYFCKHDENKLSGDANNAYNKRLEDHRVY